MKKITLLFVIFAAVIGVKSAAFSASYTLGVGQFSTLADAEDLLQYLNSKDYPVYIKYGQVYEVRVGNFSNFNDAQNLSLSLRDNERLTTKIIEDSNLESPLMEEHINKKSDEFIVARQIADYRIQKLVRSALAFIYHPYIYGGQQIGTGIDCSYFTKLVYQSIGIELPRTAREQIKLGDKIAKQDLEVGDLIFFQKTKNGRINHVGMYFGNNEFIHATRGAKRVTISNLSESYYAKHYAGARRILKKP